MDMPERSNLERTRNDASNTAVDSQLGETQDLFLHRGIDASLMQRGLIDARQHCHAKEQRFGRSREHRGLDHRTSATQVNGLHFHA